MRWRAFYLEHTMNRNFLRHLHVLHEAWNPTPAQEKELQKLIDWVDSGPPAKAFIAKMNKLIDSVKGVTPAENKAIKAMVLDQVKAHLAAWGSDMDESVDPLVAAAAQQITEDRKAGRAFTDTLEDKIWDFEAPDLIEAAEVALAVLVVKLSKSKDPTEKKLLSRVRSVSVECRRIGDDLSLSK